MNVICPICDSGAGLPIETFTDTGTQYSLYACGECQAHFWLPMKNPGAEWYEHDVKYADRNSDPILTPNEKHMATLAYFSTPGSVLDVGCGVGNFLAEAQRKGWECSGIDFDPAAVAVAQKRFGLSGVSVDEIAHFAATHSRTYTLVSFFDVFEHIDNHNEFLKTARQLVASGGHIALSVPYRHSWRWFIPFDLPPRHLTRWDEVSLGMVLQRHGFTVRKIVRHPATIYFIALKLRFLYGSWTSIGLVRKARTLESTKKSAVSETHRVHESLLVRTVKRIARLKDLVLFGLPALCIWLVFLFTRARYTDFTVIAQKTDL